MFVHLGPGPARDIISSLLYGTSFDYIVETADDDPHTLRRVVLTARGLGDSSGDVMAAGAAALGCRWASRWSHRGLSPSRTSADDARMVEPRQAQLPG